MTEEISSLNSTDRPDSVALTNELERIIYEIGGGKLTPIEILGCLDFVSKEFYRDNFCNEDN